MAYHIYDNPKTMAREIRGEKPDEYATVCFTLLLEWQDDYENAVFHVPSYFRISKPWGYFREENGYEAPNTPLGYRAAGEKKE